MANLEYITKNKSVSRNCNRFYSRLDMAIIKKDIASRNSKHKRGEIVKKGNEYISVCGCGCEGCFIHSGFDSITQEEFNKFALNKTHIKY